MQPCAYHRQGWWREVGEAWLGRVDRRRSSTYFSMSPFPLRFFLSRSSRCPIPIRPDDRFAGEWPCLHRRKRAGARAKDQPCSQGCLSRRTGTRWQPMVAIGRMDLAGPIFFLLPRGLGELLKFSTARDLDHLTTLLVTHSKQTTLMMLGRELQVPVRAGSVCHPTSSWPGEAVARLDPCQMRHAVLACARN